MSCVVLRVHGRFLRQRCAEPVAVSYQADATPEVIVETLVSLLQGRRVLRRGRQPCEYLLKRLFAFDRKGGRTVLFACPARLVDKTAWTHLAVAHTTLLYPLAVGCRLTTTFIHDYA